MLTPMTHGSQRAPRVRGSAAGRGAPRNNEAERVKPVRIPCGRENGGKDQVGINRQKGGMSEETGPAIISTEVKGR